MSKHSWVHDKVDENTPLTVHNLQNPYMRITYADDISCHTLVTPQDKLVPLICERCGGNINKDTYKCEHCGTQYEWR